MNNLFRISSVLLTTFSFILRFWRMYTRNFKFYFPIFSLDVITMIKGGFPPNINFCGNSGSRTVRNIDIFDRISRVRLRTLLVDSSNFAELYKMHILIFIRSFL